MDSRLRGKDKVKEVNREVRETALGERKDREESTWRVIGNEEILGVRLLGQGVGLLSCFRI